MPPCASRARCAATAAPSCDAAGRGAGENSDGRRSLGPATPPRPRTSPGEGEEAEGGERECPRHHPVRSAPLRPGMAASSAVAPAVPGPAPGAPRPPGSGSGCARGTRRVGVGWCCLGRTPTPTHTRLLQRVCVVSCHRSASSFPVSLCLSVRPRVYWFPTLSTFQLRSQGSHFIHPLVADPGSFLVRPAF